MTDQRLNGKLSDQKILFINGWPAQEIMNAIEMRKVTLPTDIKSVTLLAKEIWNEHFVPIVGQAQVDYMLDKFQSVSAIARQIAEGYEYYLVLNEAQRVGYFAFVLHPAGFHARLSKIYVRQARRGHGIGKAIMAFVEKHCIAMGIRELWLTVNRHNTGSIAFYQSLGFNRSECIVQDIGNGFVMDDYKMTKIIGRLPPA